MSKNSGVHAPLNKEEIPIALYKESLIKRIWNSEKVNKYVKRPAKIGLMTLGTYAALNGSVRNEVIDTIDDTIKYGIDGIRFSTAPIVAHQIQPGDNLWNLAEAEVGKDDVDKNHTRNLRDYVLRDNTDSKVVKMIREHYGTYAPIIEDSQLVAGSWIVAPDLNGDGRFGY